MWGPAPTSTKRVWGPWLDRVAEYFGDLRVGQFDRPEKIRPGGGDANSLEGTVKESAYIGVSTQYIVETANADIAVVVLNDQPGNAAHAPGERLTLSWDPESTFVVDMTEEPA